MSRVAIIGGPGVTNLGLAEAWRDEGIDAGVRSPRDVLESPPDTALVRLDVLRTLDGVEPGIETVRTLEALGVRVLNRADALLAAHDKLQTAALLAAAGLPQPVTVHLRAVGAAPRLEPPLVLKPRYGAWGADVFRCETRAELERTIEEVRDRPWFRRHGALLQQLLPSEGWDLRLIVAGSRIVGSVERHAGPGEWRTNVSLGATRVPVAPPPSACALAFAAAKAIGADLVGVDLLPLDGGWIVLELNGAVDFDEGYSLAGGDAYLDAAAALGLRPSRAPAFAGRAARPEPAAARSPSPRA